MVGCKCGGSGTGTCRVRKPAGEGVNLEKRSDKYFSNHHLTYYCVLIGTFRRNAEGIHAERMQRTQQPRQVRSIYNSPLQETSPKQEKKYLTVQASSSGYKQIQAFLSNSAIFNSAPFA